MKTKMKFRNLGMGLLLVLLNLVPHNSSAQDGEKLFKSNCMSCHKPDKAVVGPALKGVKEAWAEAGESELLYDWVKNAKEVIESGKSKKAEMIMDYNPSMMTNQALSNAEIDAVFQYIEDFVPKVQVAVDPNAAPIDYFANKTKTIDGWTPETNRMIFWLQVMLMLLLIFSIFTVSKSIQTVVEVAKRSKKILGIVVLFTLLFQAESAFAFDISMSNEKWLDVTSQDNLIFLGINIILLGIFLYMKNVMQNITNSYYPEIQLAKEKAKKAKVATSPSRSVLTNMVPLEEEKSILLEHDYDGIQELDNHLPPWWLWSFYASIIFAFYYVIVHDVIKTSPDNVTLYEQHMQEAEEEKDAYIMSLGDLWITEDNVSILEDNLSLEKGKEVYEQRCATCHLPKGEGQTGPNLTDKYWIYGGAVNNLFTVIKYGVAGKMPSHERMLTGKQIQEVSSYVMSLPESPMGKAPQGEEWAAPKIQKTTPEIILDLDTDPKTDTDIGLLDEEGLEENLQAVK